MLAEQEQGGWAAVFTLENQTEESLAVFCLRMKMYVQHWFQRSIFSL
jgi:hypothetical protein